MKAQLVFINYRILIRYKKFNIIKKNINKLYNNKIKIFKIFQN